MRQIKSDIPRLAYHLLSLIRGQSGPPCRIEPEAMNSLVAYDWPGNVRELRNVLERASSVAKEGAISEEQLPLEIRDCRSTAPVVENAPQTLKDETALAERRAIQRALSLTRGNRAEAARLLGIHRTGLYQKMKRYGLESRQRP